MEPACKRKVFNYVDAIEIKNGKLSDDESDMAAKAADRLDLPGTGGSDAHRMDEVGKWITDFEQEIHNEQELVENLRTGRFTIV